MLIFVDQWHCIFDQKEIEIQRKTDEDNHNKVGDKENNQCNEDPPASPWDDGERTKTMKSKMKNVARGKSPNAVFIPEDMVQRSKTKTSLHFCAVA